MKPINTIEDKKLLAILLEVKAEVKKLLGKKLRQLILFGSYARNDYDPESDIDIMILVEESEDDIRKHRDNITDIMSDLSMKHEKLISLIEIPYRRYNEYLDILPFYRNVYEEGIEIHGQKTA